MIVILKLVDTFQTTRHICNSIFDYENVFDFNVGNFGCCVLYGVSNASHFQAIYRKNSAYAFQNGKLPEFTTTFLFSKIVP